MTWELIVARSAQKELERLPSRERERIISTLREMQNNPLSGDVKQLRSHDVQFRRRVGNYRILFDLNTNIQRIEVVGIERRSEKTYRRR
jgi:mRNA interferase RelE/StbE